MKPNHADIFDVTTEDFQEKVLNKSNEIPVLVDYWAEWCSPCIVLAPVLEKALNEYQGRVLLGKVEVDDNMKLAGQYKLRGFPTVILYINGDEVARFSGAKPLHFVREFLDQHLPDTQA
jgi:putative thioredoxin